MEKKLQDIPLFAGLSQKELDLIKTCLKEKTFDKGEVLFHEGMACERIFIVKTGRVKMFRMSPAGREQTLQTLEAGDTCACNPGSPEWSCSGTAQAVTPCAVWYFSRNDYMRMVASNSVLSHTLNQVFAERLRNFCTLIEEVSLKDVKKRLVKFLLDMLQENKSAQSNHTLQLPFTREEIAQRIGTARETVARYLYQLKRARLIDIKPKQIMIKDKAGLEKLLR